MRRPHYGDGGQALPVYVTAIGALLFLAFAYFAVGQAAVVHGGAQTAADAAALAAAQDTRHQLRARLLDLLGQGGPSGLPGSLSSVLAGRWPGLRDSCPAAARFAAANKAHLTPGGCTAVAAPRQGYTVSVESDEAVGRSVIPGTSGTRAQAQATAVVEPLCSWQPGTPQSSAPPVPAPGTPPAPSTAPAPSASATALPAGTLVCAGGTFPVDPAHLDPLPSAADLFSVHLTS